MECPSSNDTRNFALIGHSGDGKTSLGEAILHAAGEKNTLGKVDDGSSSLDTLPEEKKRQTTISSSIYGFDYLGKRITLVDTPGDSNFQADGQVALHALDAAVLVVSAVSGAKVGTERMWRSCQSIEIPVLAFVNGMDRERANFANAVESLRGIDANPVPLALPIGAESKLAGVVDLVHMKAIGVDGEGEIPAELAKEAKEARQRLVESVAECDDTLLEKYLEEGELSEEEIAQGLVAAVRARQFLPVLCVSAISLIGVGQLLWSLEKLLPSQVDRGSWPGAALADAAPQELQPDPEAAFAGVVFKTLIDR